MCSSSFESSLNEFISENWRFSFMWIKPYVLNFVSELSIFNVIEIFRRRKNKIEEIKYSSFTAREKKEKINSIFVLMPQQEKKFNTYLFTSCFDFCSNDSSGFVYDFVRNKEIDPL